jgi:hypothetical protein
MSRIIRIVGMDFFYIMGTPPPPPPPLFSRTRPVGGAKKGLSVQQNPFCWWRKKDSVVVVLCPLPLPLPQRLDRQEHFPRSGV